MAAMKVLFLLLAALSMAAVEGQQPPACVSQLVPCANYLNSTSPPASCCTPLKDAVKKDLPCLCSLLNNPSLLKAFGINITQVLQLPKRCGITSGTSICKTAVGAPSPAPSTSTGSSAAPSTSTRPSATPGASTGPNNGAAQSLVYMGMPGLMGLILFWWSLVA